MNVAKNCLITDREIGELLTLAVRPVTLFRYNETGKFSRGSRGAFRA